ncbi:histidine phosphatase family protein [Bacillus pseudomycoides]|uniref:histidine phosphatase family protein n=1 Tax=Bacillus pseudomycoides TaxID=64104 RepID=UPI000BFBC477|nr:histidine phosphatase family protein [Bacillus pseudomycoides]PHE53611.1 histidine phosphatase family protein [Bacillus pseudomycoides]
MQNGIRLYVIRHGEAEGNRPEDPLTSTGKEQANQLADFLIQQGEVKVDRLISSPYIRAQQTAEIIDRRLNIDFLTDDRLRELDFGNASDDVDLKGQLRIHFQDFELKFERGESNRDVMERVSALVNELLQSSSEGMFILITHRVTMTLLLRYFDESFGFIQCMKMTNPDVYVVTSENGNIRVEDIWLKD